MKSSKSLLTLAIVALFAVGTMFAADAKKEEAKQAGCCAKAEKAGEKCGHSCCAEAAKAGNNCEKCGGSGKVAAKPADAKK